MDWKSIFKGLLQTVDPSSLAWRQSLPSRPIAERAAQPNLRHGPFAFIPTGSKRR